MNCPQCHAAMEPAEVRCDACGQMVPMTRPRLPDPVSNYPERSFEVQIDQLVGWTDEQVLLTLGEPDEKTDGRCWLSPEPFDPPTILTAGSEVIKAHRFGPGLPRIPTFTPYQTWTYHNVGRSVWMLYMTEPNAHPIVPPGMSGERESPRSIGDRIQGFLNGGHRMLRPSGWMDVYHLQGPLIVADFTSYPMGAVF